MDVVNTLTLVLSLTLIIIIILGLLAVIYEYQWNKHPIGITINGKIKDSKFQVDKLAWSRILSGHLTIESLDGNLIEVVFQRHLDNQTSFYLGLEKGERVQILGHWDEKRFHAISLTNPKSNITWKVGNE